MEFTSSLHFLPSVGLLYHVKTNKKKNGVSSKWIVKSGNVKLCRLLESISNFIWKSPAGVEFSVIISAESLNSF